MSRSYKKPVGKVGCNTEKLWKRFWHKKLRHSVKQLLHEGEEDNFPHYRQKSNIWDSPSDGKMFYLLPDDCDKDLFDKEYFIRRYFKKNKKWLMHK